MEVRSSLSLLLLLVVSVAAAAADKEGATAAVEVAAVVASLLPLPFSVMAVINDWLENIGDTAPYLDERPKNVSR